ncbi:MAG: tryptophan synthase subunit alpha [Planctomycetota bacterium]
MSAIDDLFQRLQSEGRKAFMPFITAGDPDLELTVDLIRELDRRGCQLCEVGIPYSDPIADGPVIQASYTRALQRGFRLHDLWEAVAGLHNDCPMPRVTMVSYAIVRRAGMQAYIEQARSAGFAGAIVPDLPVEEASDMRAACAAADFSLIQLIAPTTPDDRAKRIADSCSGFIYYVSVTGITGERKELPPELMDRLAWLREQTPLPICIGFGISQPAQARMLSPVADGVIVGSAIVKRITQQLENPSVDRGALVQEIGEFASSMLDALSL